MQYDFEYYTFIFKLVFVNNNITFLIHIFKTVNRIGINKKMINVQFVNILFIILITVKILVQSAKIKTIKIHYGIVYFIPCVNQINYITY